MDDVVPGEEEKSVKVNLISIIYADIVVWSRLGDAPRLYQSKHSTPYAAHSIDLQTLFR